MDKPTRIKYTLTNNKYMSNQKFLGNEGTLLTAIIEPTLGKVGVWKEYELVLTPVELIDYTKFTEAKKLAKLMLKKYGVQFFEETRNKKGSTNV